MSLSKGHFGRMTKSDSNSTAFERLAWAYSTSTCRGTRADQETHNLDGNDFHNGHRWEDHRIADVRPLGGGHARGVDKDSWISGCARRDPDQIVIGNLQEVIADEQDNRHRRKQDRDADKQHRQTGLRHGTDKRLSCIDAHGSQEHRQAEIPQYDVGWQRHDPEHWTGSAQVPEKESDQQRPAADAERDGPN